MNPVKHLWNEVVGSFYLLFMLAVCFGFVALLSKIFVEVPRWMKHFP